MTIIRVSCICCIMLLTICVRWRSQYSACWALRNSALGPAEVPDDEALDATAVAPPF